MKKIAEITAQLAAPVAAELGCTVWDVEYVKEAGTWYLRLYLDAPGGVTIDQCESVSRRVSELLDDLDPIEGSYIFEVSSPGLNRVLKRPSDFERFMGSLVTVRLYRARNGKKEITGALTGFESGNVLLTVDGTQLWLDKSEVAQVRLYVEW
jgi:ribosome maturation factor RimP